MRTPFVVPAVLLLVLASATSRANPPYVLDVDSWGTPTTVTLSAMAFTPSGDVAVTGHFEGTLHFGGVDTLVAVDKEDVYLAVLAPDGAPRWAISFGGASHQLAGDLTVDANGNFALCGYVFERADLGGGEMIAPNLLNPYVVMFDATGGYLWGVLPDFDDATALAFTDDGDLLVTGTKDGFVGPPTPVGGRDVYLARYDANGTRLFETRVGTPGDDDGGDVLALPDGGWILGGSVSQNWPVSSFADAFLARYDASGAETWRTTWGGIYDDEIAAIGRAADGSLYFGGNFNSPDAPLLSEPHRFIRDWFVARADSNGTVQWVRNGGWLEHDQVTALAVAPNGDVAVTGSIRGTQQLGDVLVAYFDAAGAESLRVAFPAPDDAPDQGRAILLDAQLDMLVGGVFQGDLAMSWFEPQSEGVQDAFFARVRVPPLITSAPGAPGVVGARLRQNHPNPFNPRTTIAYVLDAPRDVAIEIYDGRGRRVRTLHAGTMPAGEHTLTWDGRDDDGRDLASGVYRYRLASAPASAGLSMVLLR